jgi:hypothetical protein
MSGSLPDRNVRLQGWPGGGVYLVLILARGFDFRSARPKMENAAQEEAAKLIGNK